MLTNALRYKDYVAVIAFDESADAFHGRVVGMRDGIDFYGRTPEELRREFRASVEDYLAWCTAEGVRPEKSWKGKLTVRPSEEQRRRFMVAAAAEGRSVNAWAIDVLDAASRAVESEVPDISRPGARPGPSRPDGPAGKTSGRQR